MRQDNRTWEGKLYRVVSYSTCSSPQLDQVQESAHQQKITNQRRTHGKGGECSFCWHYTLDPRGKKSDFVHCLYALAGYNGMAFTHWVRKNSRRTSPIPPRATMRQDNRTWGGVKQYSN
ncbi:hypothetical protein AVEN_133591-1 [Araneus ventricosus]|uniref:Uncharacterized protein n=1 Tax=Araneus ventricosus TaxID=182803 RepID=A0A4Y2JJI9_ARAVE|nr:hypothetical protein AVEN_133591-1 [Araneus ventricosus]